MLKTIRLVFRDLDSGENYQILKLRIRTNKPDLYFVDSSRSNQFHVSIHRDFSFWVSDQVGDRRRQIIPNKPSGLQILGLTPLLFYHVASLDDYPHYKERGNGLIFNISGERLVLEKSVFEVGVLHKNLITAQREGLTKYFQKRQLKLDQFVQVELGKNAEGVVKEDRPYPFFNFGHYCIFLNLLTIDFPVQSILPGRRAVVGFQPYDSDVITDPFEYSYQTGDIPVERLNDIQKSKDATISFDGPNGKFGILIC